MKNIIENFINELSNDKKPLTIKRYNYDLKYFEKYLTKNNKEFNLNTLKELKPDDYEDFFIYLKDKKISNPNIRRIFNILRVFIEFVCDETGVKLVLPSISYSFVKIPNNKINVEEIISAKDVNSVLYKLKNELNLKQGEQKYIQYIKDRNMAIIRLLFENGLKISELVNINMKDINFYKKEIEIKNTDRTRVIKISDETRKDLLNYLDKIPNVLRPMTHSTQPLFVAFDANRLTYRWDYTVDEPKRLSIRQVQKILKTESEKNELKNFNAKNLRNSRIYYSLNEYSIDTVVYLFGFRSKSNIVRFKM